MRVPSGSEGTPAEVRAVRDHRGGGGGGRRDAARARPGSPELPAHPGELEEEHALMEMCLLAMREGSGLEVDHYVSYVTRDVATGGVNGGVYPGGPEQKGGPVKNVQCLK